MVFSYLCYRWCAHLYQNGIVCFDVIRAVPLCLFVYYLYKVGMTPTIVRIYTNKFVMPVVRIIGGLSLEIYIVQQYIIKESFNCLFPLNILILFLLIFFSAYIVRWMARLITQLFQNKPLGAKEVIALY